MAYIDDQLKKFKNDFEAAIIDKGVEGKQSVIRSSGLINLIHDAVKKEFIDNGINPDNIHPAFGQTKKEIKMAGYLKQKDQDICITPSNITPTPTIIDWGPLASENKEDPYGFDYSTNTLVINVRSQMSSLKKNADTLFERTFAEALNLHMRYSDIVLGEVYLIPVQEYDDELMKRNKVGFKKNFTKIEKYINFFNSINNRPRGTNDYAYEKCALLIVDFNREQPYLFKNSYELEKAGLISKDCKIKYETMNFQSFAKDILKIYESRFDINNLKA